MPGLIPHLIIALLCAIIVHLIHFKWEYSTAIFFGNLIPDIIKFGIPAAKQLTIKIFSIKYDSTYNFLEKATHANYSNWFVIGFVVFAVAAYLYHHHIIKKRTMEEYDLLYVFLLIGIIIHLLIDVLIVEHGPWV